MSERPSLHDIAAMNFPHSMLAMRKHYNRNWGKIITDSDGVEVEPGDVKLYRVEVDYETLAEDTEILTIEATSEEEAEELAREEFREGHSSHDEIVNVSAKEKMS